jgi:phasin family protein
MEIKSMQNESMEFYKDLTNRTVESVKRLSELNLRTFETLAAKQVEMMQSCVNSGVKQAEVLSANRDIKEMLTAQAELSSSCAEQFSSNMMETADILKTAQEEYAGLVEESVAEVKENVAKVTEISKKSVDEAMQAAKPAKTTKKAA